MKTAFRAIAAFMLGILAFPAKTRAADGEIQLRIGDSGAEMRVDGDKDEDWWIQRSEDLASWTTLKEWGTWLSGNETNAPWRLLSSPATPQGYYRALKTEGLFDPAVFRTISLTFTQSNWGSRLQTARTTGSNVLAQMVTLDNGATNFGVGARYKGNTSFTMSGTKKSINLEFDFATEDGNLMDHKTVNLNNAFGDETIMREPVYFTVMSQYAPSPRGAMARVHVNGSLWGVYSMVEQENGDLISNWFPSNDGDRWGTPNAAMGGGGGGGGGFSGSTSAFSYQRSTNISAYRSYYILKTDNSPTNEAWARLIRAIDVLNNTPAAELRDKVEDVFAVDNWLWFLALENIFVDDDSYWNKGADYGFYYEVESGRIHPVEHDGNESFTSISGVTHTLSPVQGATGTNRPLLYKLLPIPELRQRYLAHMRTVLEENFNPAALTPLIDSFHALSIDAIRADPNKGFTMTSYTNDLRALKTYVTNRYNFLTNHAELTPKQPDILAVNGPAEAVYAGNSPFITAQVAANGDSGVSSVWLWHRGKSFGRFTPVQMLDDGAHGDGAAGDGVYGASAGSHPSGTRVRYYVEARADNAAKAARFAPARAENDTFDYRVALSTAPDTRVVINEFMAANSSAFADPQGEFDDWIELRNISGTSVDLTGHYLTDNPNNPRKWQFPDGAIIPPDGFLIVWADEDSSLTGGANGLHASFRLDAGGESIYLTDTDANNNRVLDSVEFGAQQTNLSQGRTPGNPDVWAIGQPTPGKENGPGI